MPGFQLKPLKVRIKSGQAKAAEAAIKRAMKEQAQLTQGLFEQTVSGWQHGVSFEQTETAEGIIVGTDDEIYGYVDKGTKAHTISPKGKALRFGAGGSPKTRPGVLSSGGGSKGGTIVYTRKPVQHPGTKARDFSVKIQELSQEGLETRINQALQEALGE